MILTPYNPHWPVLYVKASENIASALGKHVLAIHHVGSTSVPGLSAKPIIDMIVVVDDLVTIEAPLVSLGYESKGEYNIPCKKMFARKGESNIHLHVFEDGHPEIGLNLCFRDYLRTHPERRDAYALLKEQLAAPSDAFAKKEGKTFTNYTHAKHDFIQETLRLVGFNALRMVRVAHEAEWKAYRAIEQACGWKEFSSVSLVFYRGVDIIGGACIDEEKDSTTIHGMVDVVQDPDAVRLYFERMLRKWMHYHGKNVLIMWQSKK